MKILVAQKVDGVAGSEKYLLNILPALAEKGLDVSFLLLHHGAIKEKTIEFENELNRKGVAVYKEKVSSVPTPFQLLAINKLIKRNNYDLVHSNLIYADLALALVKFFYNRKMKLVSGKHGYEEWYTNKFGFDASKRVKNKYWLSAWIAEKFINRSFAISDGLYSLFTGLGIIKKQNLSVIKYGFDFDTDYRFDKSMRLGDPQLVVVGRLTEFKGHRFAIKAVRLLKEKYPDIKLLIVGWGDLEEELKRQVAENNLNENVIFTGFQSRPRDIMYTSDIVLLPSVSEGLGIVVLEAMSCRRPIVAFNVPSPSEIFNNTHDALLAQPYLVEEFASMVSRLIEDPKYRVQLAENAYQKLTKEFNKERMVNETIQFYKGVLN